MCVQPGARGSGQGEPRAWRGVRHGAVLRTGHMLLGVADTSRGLPAQVLCSLQRSRGSQDA